jgi:hypothetical protein
MHSHYRFALIATFALAACTADAPEGAPPRDTSSHLSKDTESVRMPGAVPGDSVADRPTSVWTTPSSDPSLSRDRQEVLETMQSFFESIERGNEAQFHRMLSARSAKYLEELQAQGEIWDVARQSIGAIDNRKVSIVGGTRDSVALLVRDSTKGEPDSTSTDRIIITLREGGRWKIMYPGAINPNEHLIR